MKKILTASENNIGDITALRVEMQIEDWNKTLNSDFSSYADKFAEITENHLRKNLNKTIFFALMYIDNFPIAMCALEELSELPQITVCTEKNRRHCSIISVYTKSEYRGKGYQQELLKYLLNFAKIHGFSDIALTTNTPDAAHIYEKFGFKLISNKYFLLL